MSSPTGKRDGNAQYVPVYDYAYISGTTTTAIKSGAGFLHSVTFNKPVATGVLALYDSATTTNTFAVVTVPANPQPVTLVYDVEFENGLLAQASVVAQNITIAYI